MTLVNLGLVLAHALVSLSSLRLMYRLTASVLGRKVAHTEALAMLALILLNWSIEPKLGPGESISMYKERVLDSAALFGMAFTFKPVPLRFVRRNPSTG